MGGMDAGDQGIAISIAQSLMNLRDLSLVAELRPRRFAHPKPNAHRATLLEFHLRMDPTATPRAARTCCVDDGGPAKR